ncbi:acyl carrier protein [Nocardia sp. CA-129566]|uniref:acyl carrier protein n=1 Tax=Nocardia sp. CA-129566 TaxID=3239976 RepID=UPI003D99D889
MVDSARRPGCLDLLEVHAQVPEQESTLTAEDLTAEVSTSVADAIGLDKAPIKPESTLIGELGAESIELLDMGFRIHRDSGVEMSGADVAALLRGKYSRR